MKKVKYYYNTTNLRYEEIEENWKHKLLKILGVLCAVIVFSVVISVATMSLVDSPKEKRLKRELAFMKGTFENLNTKVGDIGTVLNELADKDDDIYRVIFEAEPVDEQMRKAGFGGSYRYKDLDNYSNSDLIIDVAKSIDKVEKQLYIQSKSYEELNSLIKNKNEMIQAIPSIQPVANKTLKRIASGFGMRIHPVHKVKKFHQGMDFTAPRGTAIFTTGDGVVEKATRSKRGYGNHVIINHGYGYKTNYAHMEDINVKVGQKVKRGEKIGTVGNTGLSTAPHLHYEVIYNDKRINPINFFHDDLDPLQYQQVLDLASRSNQSFD